MLLYLLIGFLLLAPSAAIFLLRNNAGAAILAGSAAAAIILTRLPDVSGFQLFGLSAKLEQQSKQIDISLDQLQRLAGALAAANLDQLAMSGQMFSGLTTEAKFNVRDNIVANLRSLGLSEADITATQGVWIGVYSRLLLNVIEAKAEGAIKGSAAEIAKLPAADGKGVPSPDILKSYLRDHFAADEQLRTLADEYQNLWSTGDLKDPSVIPFNQQMMQ